MIERCGPQGEPRRSLGSALRGLGDCIDDVGLDYLEQRGLIRLARKQILITDREAAANGTYHQPEKASWRPNWIYQSQLALNE